MCDMEPQEFKQAMENSYASTPVKSTRRIFFNHVNETVQERGYFHVDQMFGAGTGILIKQDGIFYLLTAGHVVDNATNGEFNNESPFWVTRLANEFGFELFEFLMPAQILHIGELIANCGKNVDAADLILVEMFFPSVTHMPDRYIDLDRRPDYLLRKDEFFEGQLLLGVGYPFEKNEFGFFDKPEGEFTHYTTVSRYIFDGFCRIEEDEPFMSAEGLGLFPDLSGASGGIVTNVQPCSEDVKMAGILVSAGPAIVRFIPSYLISQALADKDQARRTVADPAFLGQSPEHFWALHDHFSLSLGPERNGG